ncbi:hypothetical protein QR680_008504 [Steinernema hermaphroditum]|uniref:Serpentine receptor class gamma n=1 Tax=Steinernema hermaphroditum TaxID=289476 RepID=A0AA39IJ30_9BILA|nr:hypothetical protein QR680_008504 [Steinernema hermaphroditum]
MNAEIAMFAVSLLYGIPSFLLYVVILFQLVRPKYQKHFDNPFFYLCFLIGVVDCVGYLEFYLFLNLPTYSFFSSFYGSSIFSPSPLTTGIYFSTYLFTYLQLFGNCFLTFNRFTCIVFPLKHNKIWRVCFPISIVATVLSALAPFLYIVILIQLIRPKNKKKFSRPFFRLCFFIGVADCCGYVVYFLFYTLPLYSFFSSFFGSFLFSRSAFTTAMYFSGYLFGYLQLFGNCFLTFNRFTSIVFPLKHQNIWRYCFPISIFATVLAALAPCCSKTIGTTSKSRKAEMNLFFMMLIIFFVQSICGVHQFLIYIAMNTKDNARVMMLFSLLPWVNDFKFLSPAWVLLIVSTAIREAVLHAIPCRLLPNHVIGSMATSMKVSSSQGHKLFSVRK